MAHPTGFSAPPSQHDVSILNISDSSGSTALLPAPTKKHRFSPAELALVNATHAVPALVATSRNVQLHNATQIQVGSGSEISIVSSAERQRRCGQAQVERELADSLLNLAYAQKEVKLWNSAAQSFSKAMDLYRSEELTDGGVAIDRSTKDKEDYVTFLSDKLTSFIKGQLGVKVDSNIIIDNYYMMENTTVENDEYVMQS